MYNGKNATAERTGVRRSWALTGLKEEQVMAQEDMAASAPKASRLDRRKARTHQALIDAAVRLIAEGRGERASVQEITEEADIGFGSFYNHFESKEQLFQAASGEMLERWGQMVDQASAGIDDPAERLAVGLRTSGRLGWADPHIRGFLTGTGLGALDAPSGLAPRALRDIRAGQASGRFGFPDSDIALSAVAGGLLGLLRLHQRQPGRIDEATVDRLAEALLRLLGLPAPEAARLVSLPLPPTRTWRQPMRRRNRTHFVPPAQGCRTDRVSPDRTRALAVVTKERGTPRQGGQLKEPTRG
jgi:AcrR family transcriptional regulator